MFPENKKQLKLIYFNMKKIVAYILLVFIIPIASRAQNVSPLYKDSIQLQWVNEKYDSMTLEEKVGQLFIVAAYSNRDASHENDILKLIEQENIGGLIFMQDQAVHQIDLTNKYQTASKIPLLIGMDAEWGLAMRLKDVERFPWNMTLGALRNDELVYEVGKQIGVQANRMGVQFNFSPSVDVNVNPNNPIIGNRSFGSNPDRVAAKGIAYMNGMKAQNVLSSAKHFPGHGNTDQDSHKTLPLVPDNKADLEKYHVAPFKKMIDAGVQSIMVAHLNIPALEPDPKIPSTLSKKIITDYLKGELQFKGIIITDALNMDGVAKMYPPGDVDYRAFVAGNDILLFSQNVKVGKQKIIDAINKGEISEERLEESVKKILMAKYITGLNDLKFLDSKNIFEDLNSDVNKALTTTIFEKSSTIVKNDNKVLPIKKLKQKIAFVPLEQTDYDQFLTHLQKYTNVELVNVKNPSDINLLKDYDAIIVGAFLSNESVYKPYKLSDNSKAIIKVLPQDKKTIFSLFTSPYGLKDLDLAKFDAVTVHYQNTKEAQVAAAQTIFGAIGVDATLPVEINANLKEGKGIVTKHIKRLGFSAPENVGLGKKNF
jgi:beta-glucosidase-like glycosyl hydrolase